MNAKKYQEPKKPLNNTSEKSKPSPKNPSQEIAKEFGGRAGVEPTRFGDYEINGKCVDF